MACIGLLPLLFLINPPLLAEMDIVALILFYLFFFFWISPGDFIYFLLFGLFLLSGLPDTSEPALSDAPEDG